MGEYNFASQYQQSYEIVLDRPTLTEIIVDALGKNRSLIFSTEDGDDAAVSRTRLRSIHALETTGRNTDGLRKHP
jgi:hypothetical protein